MIQQNLRPCRRVHRRHRSNVVLQTQRNPVQRPTPAPLRPLSIRSPRLLQTPRIQLDVTAQPTIIPSNPIQHNQGQFLRSHLLRPQRRLDLQHRRALNQLRHPPHTLRTQPPQRRLKRRKIQLPQPRHLSLHRLARNLPSLTPTPTTHHQKQSHPKKGNAKSSLELHL